MDTPKLQNAKSAQESWSHIQHSPSDVLEQVSNGKIKSETTRTASPASVKPYDTVSDECQNTCTDMQDAECQTVLTGELLAGLQKRRDTGSQTIGTGDVISLNLYYSNQSGCRLVSTTCDPTNEGLHSYTTLNDIENFVDVFQGNITQFSQAVGCTVKVTNKKGQVNEAKIHYANVNDSLAHNSSPNNMNRYYNSFSRITLLYILLFFSVHCITSAVINTGFFLSRIMSSICNKLFG
jgi:hypothetical protein